MNHADRTICRVNGSQNRQYNSVITTKSDNPRVMLAIKRDGNKWLAGDRVVTQWRKCRTLEKGLVAVFYLLDSILVVVWGDRNVSCMYDWYVASFPSDQPRRIGNDLLTAVNDFKTRLEGIDCERNIVSSVKGQTTRTGANTSRTEASSWTIRCSSVLLASQTTSIDVTAVNARRAPQERRYRMNPPCLWSDTEPKEVWQRL
jgi:hypothetical protein